MRRWIAAAALATALAAGGSTRAAGTADCLRAPVVAAVSDGFRAPSCPYCAGNRGIEYATVGGEPVVAAAAGVVTFAGAVAGERYVTLQVGAAKVTVGPLATIAADVVAGRRLLHGDTVGSAAAALLLTVRVDGQYVDPAPMLGIVRYRPRLVPSDGAAAPRRPVGVLTCAVSMP